MTTQEQKQFQILQEQINRLQAEFNSLKASTTLPLDIVGAMSDRLKPSSTSANGTAASTETQTVNEAGSDTYNVAKPMDGFITIVVSGISRKVPYYN